MESQSPIKRFPGTIVLPDYLTPEQVFAVEDAQFAFRDWWQEHTAKTGEMIQDAEGNELEEVKPSERFSWLRAHYNYLPAILLCVKEWKLENFPLNGHGAKIDEFPMTPADAASDLLKWTFDEIVKIYNGANEIKNE